MRQFQLHNYLFINSTGTLPIILVTYYLIPLPNSLLSVIFIPSTTHHHKPSHVPWYSNQIKKMEAKIWYSDDLIQYQSLTANYLQEAITFMDTAFFANENICKTLKIAQDPQVLNELRDLTRLTAKDGVSVIAIDKKTNKVIGAAFNKIHIKNDTSLEELANSWKCEKSKAIFKFMNEIDSLCDFFTLYNTDCLFEFLFLATSSEYKGKGIGRKLSEITIQIAQDLSKGNNVKQSIDGTKLDLKYQPKVIFSIFTSFITQKIGRQLGYQIAAEKNYRDFIFEGVSLASITETGTEKLTLEYKKL